MNIPNQTLLNKLYRNLPWLVRYPFVRADNFLLRKSGRPKHLIFTIANHFEPAWSESGGLDLDGQKRNLEKYVKLAEKTGNAVLDSDGSKFRHTNFYPAEQYDPGLLQTMAKMQAEGLGEVEIHLHHGVDHPDTAENTRRALIEFRDILANEHKCLSQVNGEGDPKYAFVHGNLALANSADGNFCGVDDEMQILQETGCYVDMTYPTAPDITQVPLINRIYEFDLPIDEKAPQRSGKSVTVNGKQPQLPLIFTGPLMLNWTRLVNGIPVPRLDDGALVESQNMDFARLNRWVSSNITVKGQPNWVFIKLYCHGFFIHDQSACIGERAAKFFSEVIENGEKTGDYKVHFASAREAFNMVSAAIDGKKGNPGQFRDYVLRSIMSKFPQINKNVQIMKLLLFGWLYKGLVATSGLDSFKAFGATL